MELAQFHSKELPAIHHDLCIAVSRAGLLASMHGVLRQRHVAQAENLGTACKPHVMGPGRHCAPARPGSTLLSSVHPIPRIPTGPDPGAPAQVLPSCHFAPTCHHCHHSCSPLPVHPPLPPPLPTVGTVTLHLPTFHPLPSPTPLACHCCHFPLTCLPTHCCQHHFPSSPSAATAASLAIRTGSGPSNGQGWEHRAHYLCRSV